MGWWWMKYRYECSLCGWATQDFEYEEQDEVHECLEFMEYCEKHLESEHPEVFKDPNREPVMEYFPKKTLTEDASGWKPAFPIPFLYPNSYPLKYIEELD